MSSNKETFIIKLKDQFSKPVENIKRSAKRAKIRILAFLRSLRQTNSEAKKLSLTFNTLRSAIAGVAVVGAGSKILGDLSEYEKSEAILTNTLGTLGEAQKKMKMISDFASKTPFQVDALTASYVKLANRGFVPATKELTKLGDIASYTSKDFDQLTEALLDAETGEFDRLKEFGIKASKTGKKVTFLFKEQKKQVDFTAKSIRKYILSLGEMNGVKGASVSISKTTGGQISNLKDKVTQLSIKIGKKLKPNISSVISKLSKLTTKVSKAVDWIDKNSESIKKYSMYMSPLIAGIGSLIVVTQLATLKTKMLAVAQGILSAVMTANPIGLVVSAIVVLVGALVVLYKRSKKARAVMKGLWEATKFFGNYLVDTFTSIPTLIITAFRSIPIAIKEAFNGVGQLFSAIMSGDFKKIPEILNNIVFENASARVSKNFIRGLVESGKDMAGSFTDAYDKEMSKKEKKKKAKEKAVNGGIKGLGSKIAGGKFGSSSGGSSIGSGLSEIKASAPKTFNINIGSLIKEQVISTTNLNESKDKIKELVTNALLTAVNDAQIIS